MSCTYNGFTQEVIKANIIVAKDRTLSVKEEIRNHSSKDILLLSKRIYLDNKNEEVLISKKDVFRNNFFQYKNTDGKITYTVVPPKSRYDDYFYADSIFFIDFSYLSLMKSTFDKKKI